MATSGTATFLPTRDDIIQSVLRGLIVIADAETPNANDYTNCQFALNLILKSLNADGYLNFLYQTTSFALVASKASYTIGESGADVTAPRPVKIAHAWRRDNATTPNDVFLNPMSRQEYDQSTPKSQTGVPSRFYYDPGIGPLGTFYPWLVPSDGTYTAFICMERPVQDILASGQTFDVSQQWFIALKWMLMDEVAMEYELDGGRRKEIAQRAGYWRNKMADFSQEDASVYFQPDPMMLYRGLR